MKKTAQGFSLLELAVIILILGLVTLLLWRFIEVRIQQRAAVTTYTLLERADQALTGFAMSHHRLPCPDSDRDGIENCGDPANEVAFLPAQTLGLADARAGQIRYGVLRRTSEETDPEANPAIDPLPALTRKANLTVAADTFWPMIALLGGGAFTETLPDLSADSFVPPFAVNVPLGEKNGLDFCYTLRIADALRPDEATIKNHHVHVVLPDGTARQVAYAMALPGALDTSGTGGMLDGSQESALAFDSPQRARTFDNDDRVRAVSLGTLWQRLECGEAIASIGHSHPNAATAAIMLYRGLFDEQQVLEQAVELAKAQVVIASAGILSAVGAIIDAVAAASHAVADVALEGNAASVAAAVVMAVAAAAVLPPAIVALVQATEVLGMAQMRYDYVKDFLGPTSKRLAGTMLLHVKQADAMGLYQGKTP